MAENDIGELVRKLESVADPVARATATELVQVLLQLHADALKRILELSAESAVAAMVEDELVSGVLALHGLHPDDFETRIYRAMDKLQRHFDSRGAGITLLDVNGARVRVRFSGSRLGSGPAAKRVIEDVLYEAAPEMEDLIVEGVEEPPVSGFVPLSQLVAAPTL